MRWAEDIAGVLGFALVAAFCAWALAQALDEGAADACRQAPGGCHGE